MTKQLTSNEVDFLKKKLNAIQDKVALTSMRNDDKKDFVLPSPKEIYDYLSRFAVGQERAKKILAVSAHNHYKRLMIFRESGYNKEKHLDKTNTILIGPTGSGKTFLVKKLAEFMGVPHYIADASSLTAAGYVGGSVDSLVEGLVDASNEDYDAASTGIIFIDEVDKIAKRGIAGNKKDVGGESVQQGLLKIIEGTDVSIERSTGLAKVKLNIDTSFMFIICGGAFVGLEDIIADRLKLSPETSIGLTGTPKEDVNTNEFLQYVIPDDIEQYGFIPELIGRIPLIATLEELSVEELYKILCEIERNQVEQYTELFAYSDAKLGFTAEALYAIAELAKEQKTGARGLKAIMEQVLLDHMFELKDARIDKDDVKKVQEQFKAIPDTEAD